MIILICLLTEKKSMFKADNKNVNFPTQFCLGRISKKLMLLNVEKCFLKEMYTNLQSIAMLLINRTYETFTSI